MVSRVWQGGDVHIVADRKQRGMAYRKRPRHDKALEDTPPVTYFLHPGAIAYISSPPIDSAIIL